jgi:tricorn protease
VDWPAVRKRYEAMLEDCVSRRDVGYVISEMISELNAGHTYYGGGDVDSGPREPVGYLGADFELDQGYYRMAKVYEGGAWDTDARSVLHDLDQKDREQFKYLFKVNGLLIDSATFAVPPNAIVGSGVIESGRGNRPFNVHRSLCRLEMPARIKHHR